MRKILFLALSCAPLLAHADNGTGSLTNSFASICLSAAPGSALFTRCQEFQSAFDSQATSRVAAGQRLEELPGQGRASTRNQNQEQAVSNELGDGWSLFVSADIGQLTRSTSFNEAAFDGNVDKLTAGLNYQASQQWLLGFALNHTRETLDFSRSNSQNNTSMNGALLSAGFTPAEHFSFDAYYGLFRGNTENTRSISYRIERTPGNFQNFEALAFGSPGVRRKVSGLNGSWLWNKKEWSGTFGVGLDQSKTILDAYTETGGNGFDLRVPKRNIKSRTGSLDFSISKTYSLNWGVLIPSARAGLRKEFDNPRRQLGVRFSQDPSNTVVNFDTSDPDTQWGEVAVGVSLVMKKGHQAFFEYRQRFAHGFLQDRSLAVGWRKEF